MSIPVHHYENAAGLERAITFAGLRDDAAAVGQTNQHAMPFEVLLLRVMDVEQNPGLAEQLVPSLDAEVAFRQLGLRETEWNQPEMTAVMRKENGVFGEEVIPPWSERSEEADIDFACGVLVSG